MQDLLHGGGVNCKGTCAVVRMSCQILASFFQSCSWSFLLSSQRSMLELIEEESSSTQVGDYWSWTSSRRAFLDLYLQLSLAAIVGLG